MTFFPDSGRVKEAAIRAFADPYTWAPAVFAAFFGISGYDQRVSDWASDTTPLFGSNHDAKSASDVTLGLSSGAMYMTAIFAPETEEDWATEKVGRIVIDTVAVGATATVTKALKNATARERPDQSNTESFPSGHSSAAFVSTTLAIKNLEAFDIAPP